jgi:hypothetical protein
VVAPAPAPAAAGRPWIKIGAVALAAVVVVGLAVSRRHHRKRPDNAVAAATVDAAAAMVDAPATVDAAPTVPVPVAADAAPPAVVADAAPARDARPSKAKPDASTGDVTVAPSGNPEADDTYDKGLAALAKKPEYTRQMGFRLRDQYDDPRGWVLIGAAACPTKDTATWVQAKTALKTKGALLKKLYSLCRNNKPPE